MKPVGSEIGFDFYLTRVSLSDPPQHRSGRGIVVRTDNFIHDGEVDSIDFWVSRALGLSIDRSHGGVKIGGAGMDMGFQLVYLLGATMWPNGTKKPHGRRNGQPDRAGGYALKHRWL